MFIDPDRWEVLPSGVVVPKEKDEEQTTITVLPLSAVEQHYSKRLERHLQPSEN